MGLLRDIPLHRRLDSWRYRIITYASVVASNTDDWDYYFKVCDSLEKLERKLHGRD